MKDIDFIDVAIEGTRKSPVEPCPICNKVPEMGMFDKGEGFGVFLICSKIMYSSHTGMGGVAGDSADEVVQKWNKMVDKAISRGVVKRNLRREKRFLKQLKSFKENQK